MHLQTTPHILMVRPANFAFNEETAANNAFQSRDGKMSAAEMRARAMEEFDGMVAQLREAGVQVIVAEDSAEPVKPDAVFPNNWVTFHQDGTIVTYPMFAPTRRLERSEAIIANVLNRGFSSTRRLHFESNEARARYLEGTGSIIFDHPHRLAYACLSPRTDAALLDELCAAIGYESVVFHSVDAQGQDVYHTNVMMALGETFVVICLDSVRDATERNMLEERFAATGKEIVAISLAQMNSFAGNMLQVRNTAGQTILVMSSTAYRSLTPEQIQTLEKHTQLLHAPIETIETYGGGSARCMMAEVFLPKVS
ncbi:MAG: arginine deiminase-related protein [Saprospiraceae bacterium]|nr:arginine deiminase-related protein [Saprospiraceae bacterium]